MARLRDHMASTDPVTALSRQETQVLDLIGEGLTNRQIAERMSVAEKTAKNYVSTLLAKLGLHSRTQVAVLAARRGTQAGADAGGTRAGLAGSPGRGPEMGGGRAGHAPAHRADG